MSCYSLKRLIKSFEETGSLEAKPRSGRTSTCKSVAVTVLQNAEAIETLSPYGERMPGHRKRRQFKQTDAFTRGMVIGLKRAGWSIRQIAADTHLGASTVHRLWRRWLELGNVAINRNVGATRVTSARVDRRILRQAVAAPQATCTAILQHVQDTLDHSISTRTISRRLVANGLHSCRPLRRLPLTPTNRRQRLEWCRARSTWMTEWHRVVFSDESRFCLSSDSRRVRVWHRRGERSNPAAIVERPTVRQRGIMVWGAIALGLLARKVELEPIQTSELLESLMTGKHQLSKNFMENIRSVNSALAFASMGANLAPPPGYGPYCFRINGQIYHCSAVPHNIPDLFSKYKKLLCEDFARLHEGHTSYCQYCTDCVQRDIQNIFTANGKSCRDFDLPVPPDVSDFSVSTYNAEAEKNKADEMRKKIDQNAKQKLAFEAIMSTIDDNSLPQRLFFLDGPGGSGKTFLYKTLLSTIRGNNGIALPVASTRIAANLLEGGRTYHSQFKLPVPLLDTSTSSMRMTSDDAKQIREANVIIYDEATMAPKDALRCINNLLKEIMQNEKPLGGKTIVFGGDFRQTLPVVPHGTQAAIVESSIKFHPLWKKNNILKLDNNIRSIDPEFSAWLLKLGNGELTNDLGLDSDTFEIPSEMVCNRDLVKEIYGDKLLPSDFEQYTDKAILCPRNVDVDDINNRVLDILEGDSITYFSSDSIDDATPEDNEGYPPEFLNSLNPSGMPLHKLKLKVGAIIMLLRNLNTKRGLCNGTRLVPIQMPFHYPRSQHGQESFVECSSSPMVPVGLRSEDPSVYAVKGGDLAFLIKDLYYEDIAVNTSDLEAQGIEEKNHIKPILEFSLMTLFYGAAALTGKKLKGIRTRLFSI
ncbi:hypothetical protein LAZ67_10001495 [Cordylochernes scorpioides]|uniref:ATP-dependent DNA helicase n=1 Tax=Cordylochernes scorpioides TaxID=51811 RepID=A0ABY6KY30_9ARAC|nr:hypothetical protein LAZ67_10001495 [Cordylochernes scorpioides]